jgi:hypothetical protein
MRSSSVSTCETLKAAWLTELADGTAMSEKRRSGPVPVGRESAPGLLGRGDALDPLPGLVLPQVATIDGTILRVGPRRCDLATVDAVRMRTASSVMSWFTHGGEYSADYLEVRPDQAGSPIRLVITFGGRSLFRPEHLRLVAGILAGRAWQPGRTRKRAQRAVALLNAQADRIDRRNRPIDWSFRAGPLSGHRKSPRNYA